MSASDDDVQAAYAAAKSEWRAARERVEVDGLIVADEKGRPIPHPALAVERAAAAEMRAWLPEVRRLERQAGVSGGRQPRA